MATFCYSFSGLPLLIEGVTVWSDGNDPYCQLKRSNQQCLICPGRMDLVEVRTGVSLLSLVLSNTEALDVLDCSSCGFVTTVECYNDIQLGQPQEMKTEYRGPSIDETNSHSCQGCKSKLDRLWQYCPTCGVKYVQPTDDNKVHSTKKRVRFAEEKSFSSYDDFEMVPLDLEPRPFDEF